MNDMVMVGRRDASDIDRALRPFWREGRIVRWPARAGRRRLILKEAVRALPMGRRMPEAEVDTRLAEIWPDYCLLRRALIDGELLNRKDGIYWRVG
jgi:hypothetical protein